LDKTAAISVALLANCILLHAYSRITAAPSCASKNTNLKTSYSLLNKLS